MKYLLLITILITALFCGCTDTSQATDPEVTITPLSEPIPGDVTEFYTYLVDGVHYRITDANEEELEYTMAKNGEPDSCWHWTHDEGDWFFRPCGMTLAQSCYVIDSSAQYGFRTCGEDNPGGSW